MNPRPKKPPLGMWLAIGIGIGAAVGVASGNIAIGTGVGAAIGVAIDAAARQKRLKHPHDEEDKS